jgi:hypothetical protein
MEINIEKTVRSTYLPIDSLTEWALGQGAHKELFEDPKLEINGYVQDFDGWTIGMDEFEGEENFPIFARIERGGRVFVYGLFTEKEDDWSIVQKWFLEQTGIQLGTLSKTTQTVTVGLNVRVDLFSTAEKFGVEFNPDEFPAVVFLMESDLIIPENPQCRIILFASGRIMFTMLNGNIQLQEDKEKFHQMINTIASDLVPIE